MLVRIRANGLDDHSEELPGELPIWQTVSPQRGYPLIRDGPFPIIVRPPPASSFGGVIPLQFDPFDVDPAIGAGGFQITKFQC